jgi:DNA/RNA endonuclease G (NUC1)
MMSVGLLLIEKSFSDWGRSSRMLAFFPNAGGTDKDRRSLQMTTIDPHDFSQPGLKVSVPVLGTTLVDFSDFKEPTIQVWENVTFADNYYQNIANPDGSWTPNGREIVGADININLSGRTGFRFDDGKGGPHSRVLAWYAGTLNLADENLSVEYLSKPIENLPVLDRLSDFALSMPKDEAEEYLQSGSNLGLWYSNLGQLNSSTEGIGLGWANSVQAGGTGRRAGASATLTPVTYDNTATPRMRGDYAVSTLFDGNFDAVNDPRSFVRNTISTAIPGWSFHGGGGNNSKTLVDWREIGLANRVSADSLSYMEQLGINAYASDYQAHYALELESGESITHNEFIVPDWGVLRFDLFAPNLTGGRVNVTLDAGEGSTPFSTFVNLTPAVGSASEYLADTQRIGYGSTGFETFTFDVPDRFRGKTATLRFESIGPTVYLDNVFFKSQSLLLGNPTLNGNIALPELTQPNNYLLEKTQYTVSYNSSDKGPNWVSYQLNRSWLGSLRRPDDAWQPDPQLPSILPVTTTENYANLPGELIIHRGHMVTQSHRNRASKDQLATYLTSSILPQHSDNNSDFFESAWYNLEKYASEQLVRNENKELYIISGGFGSRNSELPANHQLNQNQINFPSATWKIIVVLEPGQGLSDITENTRVISVVTPNTPKPTDPEQFERWRNWKSWRYSVDFIEAQTGLDLLSNIPKKIQDILEARIDGSVTAPLLTDSQVNWMSPSDNIKSLTLEPIGTLNILPFGTRGFADESSLISKSSYHSTEISGSQVHFLQEGTTQVGTTQVSTTQVSTTQLNSSQLNSSQNSFPQIHIRELPLASRVTLQQLFSSHNFSLQNTTVPTWLEYLQGTTPFNLNIEIADLPTGQLAEANITGFDPTGHPNSGTLYLDTDANGLGWYIDSTPWDNTEFSTSLTDTAYRATADSLAYGHYDLLTTLLHETSHLQGFIAGYSTYSLRERFANDTHIQTLNGSKTFVGDGFSAILTPDGSHLSSSVYTYDLMNTTLTPGVRKLPSALDIQLLNEGTPAQFSAAATIAGNQPLAYTWIFGDSTAPVQGQTIQHTYTNNGTYTITLVVNSNNGPTATDPGTLDTLTYSNSIPALKIEAL